LAALLLALSLAGSADAATSVTLAWDPNPPAENVVGYVIHYGQTSRSAPGFAGYSSSVDVGNQTQGTVAGLDETKDHYFAVVAYNAQQVRSDYSLEVTAAATAAPQEFTLTASAGAGGTIAPNGVITVTEGENRTFTVSPAAGYEVADVRIDGASIGSATSYTFSNIVADHTIRATFQPVAQTFTVTASAGTGGTIAPNGVITVTEGQERTFSISPASGYEILDVLVDGVSVGPVSSYAFPDVAADHTISASFAALDGDGDGLPDQWELQYFGNLSAAADGDLDGDGIDNYTEFLQGTDPTRSNLEASLTPAVRLPVSGGTVTTLTPSLSLYNPISDAGAPVTYEFEVSRVAAMSSPVAFVRDAAAGVGTTGWSVPPGSLADRTRYYWRARLWSGSLASPWTPVCTFYVDTQGTATAASDPETAYVLAATNGSIDVTDAASATYRVAVDLPAGTLPYDYVATVRTVENAPAAAEARIVGKVYEFGPHGIPLNEKVKIWVPYSDGTLAAAAVKQPTDLSVFTYDTTSLTWEPVPVWAVDYLGQRLVCEVEHFSMYAIGVRGAGSTTPPPTDPPAPTESGGGGGGGGGCFLQSLR
jgi:hypothetical protein